MTHRRTPKLVLLLLTLTLIPWTLGLVACSGGAPSDVEIARPELVAQTAAINAEIVPGVTWITGSVTAARRADVGTKILGRVEHLAVDEGEIVARGDLLVRLDDGDLRAALAQAEAAVTMAEAQRTNARAQHARMAQLHERGSVTDKNLEDAVAGLRIAEAAVEQAEANVAAARATLVYATVTSPFAGVVVATHVEQGDMARPGAPLVTVEDLATVDVVAQVPEAQIAGRAEGDAVKVEVFGRTLTGAIHRLVPAGDPASRSFRVEIRLNNDDGSLKSGMFARVGLPGEAETMLLLPAAALVERGQLRGAWVVAAEAGDENVANLRWLRLGAEREIDGRAGFEVLSGLEAGERVVLDPPPGLVAGSVVRNPKSREEG